MSRVLGLDYGTKRLGVALSDEDRILATSLSVETVSSDKQSIKILQSLCDEHQVAKVVVGLPLNMDGSASEMTRTVQAFVLKLREVLTMQVVTWDERLTSKAAENILIEAGVRRDKRKNLIDKLAAQIMLQGYLDSPGPCSSD